MSRMAWRTFGSVKGAWSTAMVMGSQLPASDSSSTRLESAEMVLAWAKGTSTMASTSPELSALTSAAASAKSMIWTSSR